MSFNKEAKFFMGEIECMLDVQDKPLRNNKDRFNRIVLNAPVVRASNEAPGEFLPRAFDALIDKILTKEELRVVTKCQQRGLI